MTIDYTTLNCNREYSGSALGNILNSQLYNYSDTVFTNLVNRKSTFSYIYKLVGGPVLYKLSKQLILITLTMETVIGYFRDTLHSLLLSTDLAIKDRLRDYRNLRQFARQLPFSTIFCQILPSLLNSAKFYQDYNLNSILPYAYIS